MATFHAEMTLRKGVSLAQCLADSVYYQCGHHHDQDIKHAGHYIAHWNLNIPGLIELLLRVNS